MKKVDIIVPVYRGLGETKECIDTTLKSLPLWANLIVINDCSPDPELTKWLREYSENNNFQLLENEENRGFVATVNRGMVLNPEHDVLLLNSDVEVANSDWLERMRYAAYSKKNVGSITPFSNNATICSFPNFCEDNGLFADLSVDELDNIFSSLELKNVLVEVPTGVGFCMYITRDALNEVGYFDEDTFGKGYGEENDWCQRALNKGWLNYHQLNVFVYHKGGVSFAEEGDPRKLRAQELLESLHPTYAQQVQQFIANNPAANQRMAAIISYLNRSKKKKVLLVSHRLGGGVQQHIDEIIKVFSKDADFVLVCPSRLPNAIVIKYFSGKSYVNQHQIIDLALKFDLFIELLTTLKFDCVHFHHTMGIPKKLFEIVHSLNLPYDFTAHDYYLFSGNPTLTNIKGKFVGDSHAERDTVCAERYPVEEPINLFKINSEKFLLSARRVIFPSVDEYVRFLREFPCIKDKSIVCYHPDLQEDDIRIRVKEYQPSSEKKLRVLVLGALSQEKGADELEFSASNLTEIEFHLLGYAYRPLSSVVTHGPYKQNELFSKITAIEPDVIWFPAKWPETYSYTLSTALLLPYPIICPDLGAFSERTFNQSGIVLLNKDLDDEQLVQFWKSYSKGDCVQKFTVSHIEDDFYIECFEKEFYKNEYLNFNIKKNEVPTFSSAIQLAERIGTFSDSLVLGKRERVLAFLWKLRNLKVLSVFVRLIPYRLQRAIKRKLCSKPIHDVFNKK
jgi:GT2 family glycosyltransferase/glycosyltransferase involved in cell wall biosynthesis